jgi:hypothetical protein
MVHHIIPRTANYLRFLAFLVSGSYAPVVLSPVHYGREHKEFTLMGLLYGTNLNLVNLCCDVIFSLIRKICYTVYKL